MKTLELVIYITVAIIIGSLILLFTMSSNPKSTYKNLINKDIKYYQEINSKLLVEEMIKTWNECALGEKELSKSYKITDSTTINKTIIISELNNIHSCQKISLLGECGYNFEVNEIKTPAIISMKCSNNKLIIK